MKLNSLVLLVAVVLSGCSSVSRRPTVFKAPLESLEPIPESIAEIPRKSLAPPPKLRPEIEQSVGKWIHYFTEKDPERFERFLERGTQYEEIVRQILRKNGVPDDFYYLAMIESGYQTHAHSRARAVGPWQFMRKTGRHFGLKQTPELDERRDIVRSTEAAARYLKVLYAEFQSWELALAAYNSGEGRVMGAVNRSRTRDYWKLVEKKALPPETRNYVPKWMAAKRIGENPMDYGLKVDRSTSRFPKVSRVEIPGGVSFQQISRRSGLSVAWIRYLNPHLLKGRTPLAVRSYPVWLPQSFQFQFAGSVWQREPIIERKIASRTSLKSARKMKVARR